MISSSFNSSTSSTSYTSSTSSTSSSSRPLPKLQIKAAMDETIKDFFLQMFLHGRNAKRENLLHNICNLNRYHLIEILLEKGCNLCQQDYLGRTPLHVAIDAGHCECIRVFQNLFRNYSSQSPSVQKQLCSLVKCYNHKGYTILHEAVIRDMRELVKDMLGFFKERKMDLRELEVLGCGDTILHLAVRKNLMEISEIICTKCPNLMREHNYGGQLPEHIHCITEEMKMLLKRSQPNEIK